MENKMENENKEIIRIDGTGYKILNHLSRSSNPKKNYVTKICNEIKCSFISVSENMEILRLLGLITIEKIGRKKYLKITEKGKRIMERLHNLQKRLEKK